MDFDFEGISTHFELNLPIASFFFNSKFGGLIAPPIAPILGSGGYSPPCWHPWIRASLNFSPKIWFSLSSSKTKTKGLKLYRLCITSVFTLCKHLCTAFTVVGNSAIIKQFRGSSDDCSKIAPYCTLVYTCNFYRKKKASNMDEVYLLRAQ